MLKKLVPMLALTSLAFGSGLCFDPYNHDYGISTKQLNDGYLSAYNKTLILHNGNMQVGKNAWINLVRYAVNGNKAIIIMRGKGKDFRSEYFVVYTECINGKPVTKYVEQIGSYTPSARTVDLPKYPIKLGFYKDGFWVKSLTVSFRNRYHCWYEIDYYPYKLIEEHKYIDIPKMKFQRLPNSNRVCSVLGSKLGIPEL